MQRHDAHVAAISLVARRLSSLRTPVVFTGGAVVGLLLTDAAAPDVQPTDDVDVIVAISRYSAYASLQDEVRKLGFSHDMDRPNCRFILDGLKVDIMPTGEKILGFSNRWYDLAVSSATDCLLPDGTTIQLISAAAFIATKLEAFLDRGKGDYIESHDIEDIIAVIDGRPELPDEIKAADADVRQYICELFAKIVNDRMFRETVPTHLLPDEARQARARVIIDRMRAMATL